MKKWIVLSLMVVFSLSACQKNAREADGGMMKTDEKLEDPVSKGEGGHLTPGQAFEKDVLKAFRRAELPKDLEEAERIAVLENGRTSDEAFLLAYDAHRDRARVQKAFGEVYAERLTKYDSYERPQIYYLRAQYEYAQARAAGKTFGEASEASRPWGLKAIETGDFEVLKRFVWDESLGVRKEALKKAEAWYASLPKPSAKDSYEMARLMEYAEYSAKNIERAHLLLERAAEAGDRDARVLLSGEWVHSNLETVQTKGWQSYKEAAEAGNREASLVMANGLLGVLLSRTGGLVTDEMKSTMEGVARVLSPLPEDASEIRALFLSYLQKGMGSLEMAYLATTAWIRTGGDRKIFEACLGAYRALAADHAFEKCEALEGLYSETEEEVMALNVEDSQRVMRGEILTECYWDLVKSGGDRLGAEGYESAAYRLAMLYLNGKMGISPNAEEAHRLMVLAGEDGDVRAQYFLANAYRNGAHGFGIDTERAAYWGEKRKNNADCKRVLCGEGEDEALCAYCLQVPADGV